jgi:hypothetical protein
MRDGEWRGRPLDEQDVEPGKGKVQARKGQKPETITLSSDDEVEIVSGNKKKVEELDLVSSDGFSGEEDAVRFLSAFSFRSANSLRPMNSFETVLRALRTTRRRRSRRISTEGGQDGRVWRLMARKKYVAVFPLCLCSSTDVPYQPPSDSLTLPLTSSTRRRKARPCANSSTKRRSSKSLPRLARPACLRRIELRRRRARRRGEWMSTG